jgi:hypothetical protein
MATITRSELIALAQSSNRDDRKRGYDIYQAWVKAGPSLPPTDRLTTTERMLLAQLFAVRRSESPRRSG